MTLKTDGTAQEPDSKARLRLWLRLLTASRKIETELRERLRVEFGTTLPRFDVMSALSRHTDGLKMSGLSGVLKVSNGNVTGIVDRLVEDGFALREQVPGDRRAAQVKLTASGLKEFARQAAAHEAWVDEMLQNVEPEQAERLSSQLADLAISTKENES